MSRYKVAILKNETSNDHLGWVHACYNYSEDVEYDIIDLTANDWLERIIDKNYHFFLARPPGRIAYYKQLYDERIYIISEVMELPVYPTIKEILIYENKRLLSYFLKAKNIACPETKVFYKKREAVQYLKTNKYPFVAKTNIGAGGSGVKIIRNRFDAENYIEKSFTGLGIKRSFYPNFRKGDYINRLVKRLGSLKDTIKYFKEKKDAATIEPQKWFVIFQEYISCDYEWRCVVVGDSYFGHKKLRSIGDMMSGTSKVSWDVPNNELLNLIHHIVHKNNLTSQAIDLFYNEDRGYLVNEMQCFWGSKNPHQMIKDGKPGRFVLKEGLWCFEEGSFNENNTYNLRLGHILSILKNGV